MRQHDRRLRALEQQGARHKVGSHVIDVTHIPDRDEAQRQIRERLESITHHGTPAPLVIIDQ